MNDAPGPSTSLTGLPGSPGVAIGRAVVVDTRRPAVPRRSLTSADFSAEIARFDEAVASASADLRRTAGSASEVIRAEASILEAYVLMVEDPTLHDDVARRVRDRRQCAEWALDDAIHDLAARLRGAGDAYLAERSHDFEFVGDRLQRALSGRPREITIPDSGAPVVVVAHDLSPAETAGFTRARVAALVTEVGTRTSHTAILARALEIPAVVGVADLVSRVCGGETCIVDGDRGLLTITPAPEEVARAERRAADRAAAERARAGLCDRPCTTACGVRVALRANIELPGEAAQALAQGAEGVGLYRTEFLYLSGHAAPEEDAQYEVYRSVISTMRGHPVTLRTFDIGADKYVAHLGLDEEQNPALGMRAVRLGLSRPELFLTQLRAMLRAAVHGSLRVMIPMIATLGEVRLVRELLNEARSQLEREGRPVPEPALGIMVEVPSAAIVADRLAREVDFFSIGTNDLVQYTLAVDRTNRGLAALASYFDPAITHLVRLVAEAGRAHDRPVAVCGAMASDPLAVPLLVGLGIRELSMESSSIPVVKQALARVTVADAEAAARQVASAGTADEAFELARAAWGADP